MVLCNIEPNKFFPGSPEICMTELTEDERREVLQTVEELQGEGEDEDNVFNWINPFERRASTEERDKHLKRLRGVQKMDQILRKMEDKATLHHHKQVRKPVSKQSQPMSEECSEFA
ncbi:uncharacterized protein LDX57_012146 [Aspergillus melleus]|uniref:uncharacterized protein n=1 Tax=Aspergillus melleus TaxID=138277 RepID=UPI001E8CBB9D|nr:uncharacterized protein LDX57_012146 [Aspergillus melleus]KAH8434501.1 hypothetical protein LDX57_012146 [Aspergillus melleus]